MTATSLNLGRLERAREAFALAALELVEATNEHDGGEISGRVVVPKDSHDCPSLAVILTTGDVVGLVRGVEALEGTAHRHDDIEVQFAREVADAITLAYPRLFDFVYQAARDRAREGGR